MQQLLEASGWTEVRMVQIQDRRPMKSRDDFCFGTYCILMSNMCLIDKQVVFVLLRDDSDDFLRFIILNQRPLR